MKDAYKKEMPNFLKELNNPAYQNRLARAIAQGICEYFRAHPPRGTALAQGAHVHVI